MSNNILAKRVSVLAKSGKRIDFTHVTKIVVSYNVLCIDGETDGETDGAYTRINVEANYRVKDLELMQVDFYIPK